MCILVIIGLFIICSFLCVDGEVWVYMLCWYLLE